MTAHRILAVDHVDLTIAPGEILGLAGESGCGKSTLARILACLEIPDHGVIHFADHALLELPDRILRGLRPAFQPIFQDPLSSLNPRFTVRQTLEESLSTASPGGHDDSLQESLSRVGLGPELLRRYPHQLSGGQRQRTCIARALAARPRLLLADEPLSSLDVSIQAQIVNLFLDLQERLHLSILFISHDLRVVGHLADRILVMYAGRIVESSPTRELFQDPRHPYTRLLFRSLPHLPAAAPANRMRCEFVRGTEERPSGCLYYPRCEFRHAECLDFGNELLEIAEGHSAACLRWKEIPPMGAMENQLG